MLQFVPKVTIVIRKFVALIRSKAEPKEGHNIGSLQPRRTRFLDVIYEH